ncbi:copper homeostasis protein [Paenibacillus yonginensis]|uniref:PF03932 family protein CutC n=1 Tax=Paenibacillus yonginensis TaxID=1462996 RepID=A0A1B1N608_9BACL|nr:copper homeostasis protein CutC [Paenibacillus yonginensis]ANS76863.1 copper homeostasis protein [Paenibacillus yonginensis]
MQLEVIATCIEDAVTAEQGGADRIELITAIGEGGLTPGIGMVKRVVQTVRIPVHVMVRPHSRSFVYSQPDQEVMAEEIKAIRQAGAAGIVIGALTPAGRIDQAALERWLPLAEGMNVTFHRAFDELADLNGGLAVLKVYPQVNRVLTSGGIKPAPQAVPAIAELVRLSGQEGPVILAGHGLTIEGISDFIQAAGVDEVHFGTAVRRDGDGLKEIDPERLRELVNRLKG